MPLDAHIAYVHDLMSSQNKQQRDYFWIGVCVLFIVLGLILEPGPEYVSLGGWPVPELCWSKRFLDIDCLGCGLTRSTVYTLHGDLSSALEYHFIGPILVVFAIYQIFYRLWKIYV